LRFHVFESRALKSAVGCDVERVRLAEQLFNMT
jgi:hypothetical protein